MNKTNHWKRNAGFFIGGQFASMFGSMLVSYAITWNITLQEKSGILVALFTCAAMLPMVIASPIAGVLADRYNRKFLINISDALIALITLGIAILYMLGYKSIWLLFVAVITRSFSQGIQQPAVNALIPQIVPEKHLMRFNAVQGTSQSITMFAAPMVAGALLTFVPMEIIFFIDVITAIIGISTVFFCVKVDYVKNTEHQAGIKAYYKETKEGISFIMNEKWLKTLLVFTALFCILAAPASILTPLQVARSFGDDVWRLTAVEIAFSVGMMIGGALISIWGGFKNKIHSMILSWILFGITTFLFGVVTNFWIYLAIMFASGGTMPLYNTPSMTLMQTRIPPEMMGRVFSAIMLINGLGMPLGMAFFGPLSDILKIEWLLIVTGALLIVGGVIMYGRKELQEIEEQ